MIPERAQMYQRLGLLAAGIFVAVGGVVAILRQDFTYFDRVTRQPISYFGASAIVIGLLWFGFSGLLFARAARRGRLRIFLTSLGLSFCLSAFAVQLYVAILR